MKKLILITLLALLLAATTATAQHDILEPWPIEEDNGHILMDDINKACRLFVEDIFEYCSASISHNHRTSSGYELIGKIPYYFNKDLIDRTVWHTKLNSLEGHYVNYDPFEYMSLGLYEMRYYIECFWTVTISYRPAIQELRITYTKY